MNVKRAWALVAAMALAAPSAAVAQESAQQSAPAQASTFELSIANMMRGPEHVGSSPGAIRWTDDSRWIYFRWRQGGGAWDDPSELYRIPASGGEPERLSDDDAETVAVLLSPGGDISPDGRRRVVAFRGDLHLIERRSLEVRQLTRIRASFSNPVFSADGRRVFFTQNNDLFELTLDGGALRQLTDIRMEPAPSDEDRRTDRQRFLAEQQIELFEHFRRLETRREEQEARAEGREPPAPRPLHLDRGERPAGIAVEPHGRWAALQAVRGGQDSPSTGVPAYVTEDGYVRELNARSKVGIVPGVSRLGLVALESGEVEWLEIRPSGIEDPRLRDRDPPGLGIGFGGWNADGTLGLVVATSHDNKDRWLFVLDARTRSLTQVFHERDDAWLAGPCFNCRGWLPDGRSLYFVSEQTGYAHLYRVNADGSGVRQVTSGEWEVRGVELSPDEDRFYLHTGEVSPFETHFYHMDFDGRRRTRITTETGRHSVNVSPDGRRLAVSHNFANRPGELYVGENRGETRLTRITTTPTEEWRSFPWVVPEIVHVEARDGVRVPARIYRPRDMGASSNGGAVIFVHGAGYLQNVHMGWSNYYREYMFHHLLASRGFTVLDIDFRASAGYGRDWRTDIYRHMGGKDLTDQVDGARYLAEHEGVDPNRIGLYGGSYGGFITLMALFTEPDHFAAGAALRAVTDWAHYNHGYTQRILNVPQSDEEAYRRSSPIYFAEGLRAPLLITHGVVDRNVQFQDVVRLAQRLIELGKTDWELALYPVEDHGFIYPSSWADQYRRIYELFDRHLSSPRVSQDETDGGSEEAEGGR